jgi:DNA-directed RNA polymerase specialized sigma24 family protein
VSRVAELFPNCAEKVLGWLTRKVGNRQVAEDIASTAWLRAVLAEQRGQTVEVAYVFDAAESAMIDMFRRERPVLMERLTGDWDPVAPDPIPDERWEIRRTLEQEYGYLSARERETVFLRALGYSFSECAAVSGITADRCKKRILVARDRVRHNARRQLA